MNQKQRSLANSRSEAQKIYYQRKEIKRLQQYILSLSKENEQEKQFIKDCGFENAQQLVLYYIGIRQEKEDYKLRIEKAVEYIKNTPLYETICDYNMEEELEIQNVSDETASNKLLDILNGRSDE